MSYDYIKNNRLKVEEKNMRILQTKCPIELLEFLENNTYKNLPKELWDADLFFYNKLLKLMSLSCEDELFNQLLMYKVFVDNEVCSIGLLETNAKTLFFIGDTLEHLKELLSYLNTIKFEINTVMINSDNVAQSLFLESNFKLNWGDKKLYSNLKVINFENHNQIQIKENSYENSFLMWDGLNEAMDEGYRYFGGFINDELKCRAGLVRISKHRSEIIAVFTISESDRNKGYSSFLCNHLIEEALKKVSIVTWTCIHSNIASFKTAQKMGMKHYLSIYDFRHIS